MNRLDIVFDGDRKTWLLRDETGAAISSCDIQAETIELARKTVANQGGGSVVIHEKDGKIRETTVLESHGYELSRSIGQTVRRHRTAAGLTRSQLSELSGIGTTAIYQIETGHPTVRLATLVSVMDVLNIKLHLSSALEGDIT